MLEDGGGGEAAGGGDLLRLREAGGFFLEKLGGEWIEVGDFVLPAEAKERSTRDERMDAKDALPVSSRDQWSRDR